MSDFDKALVEKEVDDFRQGLIRLGIDPKDYDELSQEEKNAVKQILAETAEGESDSYEQLYLSDYDEIPVDFNTFISDDLYLGKSTRHGEFLYPFWKKEIPRIFASNVNEVALSGSIGIGKSTVSMLMMAYHLYKTMCMKDPQSFFGLAPGTKITYAFLNNTLASSMSVGYGIIQSFLMESPWFLKHGAIEGRAEPYYVPEKGFEFVVGSRKQHTLGRAVICLTGDTVVLTPKGAFRLDELEGKDIEVFSFADDGSVVISDVCTVKNTAKVTKLLEIELEDGTILRCTPEHRFMMSDGKYKMAKDLTEDDDIQTI